MIRAASAALAVALVALVWALLHVGWYTHAQITDYGVYRDYGDAVVHAHRVPYRDFALEYPPAALPVFVVPSLVGLGYHTVFQALMALCDAGAVLAVLAVGGRVAAAAAAVAPLLLGSVVVSRFDFWPGLLAAWALAALVRRRQLLSGVLLGTAFAAKLWPAVVAPLFLVWLWRRDGPRASLRWLLAATATAAAWFVPFAALSPGGIGHSFHAQLARPLQIESLGASLLIAVHHLASTSLGMVDSFGSQNVVGSGVQAVTVVTSVVQALAVVAVWVTFAHGEPTVERLLVACAAAVTALLAFGKVLSPQFLIWVIPFVPLVRGVAARVVFAAALVLTQVYFPQRYWHLAHGFYSAESAVLLARNAALVALFGLLLYASHRSTAASSAARSSSVSVRSGARTSG